ncbi:O-antigen ligase family protein [Achromobacter sp. Marseille-Q4954]|uniref:O-antigen ligase family protein n=1 Tax=Achromobacter sp. Marseille-Q4954 TaxID=2942203 RepID=UPI0020742972|nr:O-antigen ligase family protein [Achromobacter sp. Marseille-Q4954]
MFRALDRNAAPPARYAPVNFLFYLFRRMTLALVLLTALLPIVNLTTGGGSGLFYALLLACMLRCFTREGGIQATINSLGNNKAVIAAMSLPLIAIVVSQLAHGTVHAPSLERGARFSIAFPIMLGAFLSVDRQALRQAIWGFLVAGWAATATILWLSLPNFNRPDTPEYNAVGYGNLLLLTLVLVAYSVRWSLTRHARAEKTFKTITAIVLFGAFVLTQTRTGWMAVPFFFAIGLLLFGNFRHPLKLVGVIAVGLALLVALGASSQALRERVSQGFHEVQECQSANTIADTSVCIRFQLWRASVQMVEASPWTGLGSTDKFQNELQARVATGVVSPFVASDFGEPHNDMLHMLTSFGLLGGIALLMVYGVPAIVFLRGFGARHPQALRTAAAMGLALTVGFAIFGLTELMFRGMRTISLYVALVAWLIALNTPDEKASHLARQ